MKTRGILAPDFISMPCADALAMPFREGTFTLVFHQGLMEHFDPPQIVDALHAQTVACHSKRNAPPSQMGLGGVSMIGAQVVPPVLLGALHPDGGVSADVAHPGT